MRAIVRLLGEAAAIRDGLLAKKSYILDGLCHLFGAREWRWAIFHIPTPSEPEQCLSALRRTLETTGKSLGPPTLQALDVAHLPPPHPAPRCILSIRPLNHTESSRIALLRHDTEAPYTAREIQLASLILDEIPWLHFREQIRPPRRPRLSPRLQHILDLLLLGLSRKEISALLGISQGTVAGYVRELYAHFGVNSQAEFMRIHLRSPNHP